jgi:hypothetical protein
MAKCSSTRFFGGKAYRRVAGKILKTNALDVAEGYKEDGYKVRIIRAPKCVARKPGGDEWQVFVRQ